MSNPPGLDDVEAFLRKASEILDVVKAGADGAIAKIEEIKAERAGHLTIGVTGGTVYGGTVTAVVHTDTITVTSDLDLRWNVAAPIETDVVRKAAKVAIVLGIWAASAMASGPLGDAGTYTYQQVFDLAQVLIQHFN